jgi:hypothetical protein
VRLRKFGGPSQKICLGAHEICGRPCLRWHDKYVLSFMKIGTSVQAILRAYSEIREAAVLVLLTGGIGKRAVEIASCDVMYIQYQVL